MHETHLANHSVDYNTNKGDYNNEHFYQYCDATYRLRDSKIDSGKFWFTSFFPSVFVFSFISVLFLFDKIYRWMYFHQRTPHTPSKYSLRSIFCAIFQVFFCCHGGINHFHWFIFYRLCGFFYHNIFIRRISLSFALAHRFYVIRASNMHFIQSLNLCNTSGLYLSPFAIVPYLFLFVYVIHIARTPTLSFSHSPPPPYPLCTASIAVNSIKVNLIDFFFYACFRLAFVLLSLSFFLFHISFLAQYNWIWLWWITFQRTSQCNIHGKQYWPNATPTGTKKKNNHRTVTQNGASQIDSNHVNAIHHNNQRHLNSDSYRKPTTMTGTQTAGTERITDVDQNTNPFVFRVQMSPYRKIMVRIRIWIFPRWM